MSCLNSGLIFLTLVVNTPQNTVFEVESKIVEYEVNC